MPVNFPIQYDVLWRGLFNTLQPGEEKVVPTTWVTELGENSAYLAVGSRLIDTLPGYEEEL